MTIRGVILAGVLLAAAGGVAADAHACGFFDYRESRPIIHVPKPKPIPAGDRIAAADQRLEEEHLTEAATQVVTAFPRIRGAAVGASPLEARAQHVLALALVRSDGKLAGVTGFTGASEVDRNANLNWAVETLRAIDDSRPDDPVAQADLAEALATRPLREGEALAILGDLAARDLIGSAHAYATLARLRSTGGDASAVKGALERCEVMTKAPTAVCHVADARVALR